MDLGLKRTKQSWTSMRNRCVYAKPGTQAFDNYAGRGVTVCDRWAKFDAFLADMGLRPEGKTLDRINCNGNYEPGNCRWATPTEQATNRRTETLRIEWRGESRTVGEWAKHVGIPRRAIHKRVFVLGWPVERALTTPAGSSQSPRRPYITVQQLLGLIRQVKQRKGVSA